MKGAGSSSEAMALWLIGAAKNWPTRVDGARETVPAESSIRSLTNLLRGRCCLQMRLVVIARTRRLSEDLRSDRIGFDKTNPQMMRLTKDHQ